MHHTKDKIHSFTSPTVKARKRKNVTKHRFIYILAKGLRITAREGERKENERSYSFPSESLPATYELLLSELSIENPSRITFK